MKRGYHGGNNFDGRVAQLPQTMILWAGGGMKEEDNAVKGEIKTTGCIISLCVQFVRVV